jgi:hypothetical protein
VVTCALGEAFGVGIFEGPGTVVVVRVDDVLEGALDIRLLAGVWNGLAELNTQAVFGGVFVPVVFAAMDDREEGLLFEETLSTSFGIGGAGLVGGATLGPFTGRLILVALPVAEPFTFHPVEILPSPFD